MVFKQGGIQLQDFSLGGSLAIPPEATRRLGFTIGNSTFGNAQAKGDIDDLEFFNDLESQQSAAKIQFSPYNLLSAKALPALSKIRLHVRDENLGGGLSGRLVSRRPLDGGSTTYPGTPTGADFEDTVVSGTKYEYFMGSPSILAGINIPATTNRGNLLLLVDNTLAGGLTKLNLLITNLVGDGWTVHVNTNAPRHFDPTNSTYWGQNPANITSVKAGIVATNSALSSSGGLKAIVILGHVAVPYSGFEATDGHQGASGQSDNHKGAWPADIFYGDLDGIWTDSLPYSGTTAVRFNATTNYAGDGRFDQDLVPTNSLGKANIEIPVGRIDFANLDGTWLDSSYWGYSPPNLELLLLNRYIDKTDAYRKGVVAYPGRVSLTNTVNAFGGTTNHAWRLAVQLFQDPSGRVFDNDPFYPPWFRPSEFAVMFGNGEPNVINNNLSSVRTSASITDPGNVSPTAFFILEGSWFGDWNLGGNFMRAALANATHGFASMWMRNQMWDLRGLAIGETFADCYLRTANLNGDSGIGVKRWLAIMGDPTLRVIIQNPPPQPPAINGSGLIYWSPPAGFSGGVYHISYSSSGINGGFTQVSVTSSTNYQSTSSGLYMIRAAALTETGSGSFTNLSQGVFVQRN